MTVRIMEGVHCKKKSNANIIPNTSNSKSSDRVVIIATTVETLIKAITLRIMMITIVIVVTPGRTSMPHAA